MRLISLMVLIGWLGIVPAFAGGSLPPPCLMKPTYLSIPIPDRGFTQMDDGGACEDVPTKWETSGTSGTMRLFVRTEGPHGTGRFWEVTIGVGGKQSSKPTRGVCMSTQTKGWLTLQRYTKGALPWLDHDGSDELIIWDDFQLPGEDSCALVAWVYRLVSKNSKNYLVIDWDSSRRYARSLAKEYRLPPLHTTPRSEKRLEKLRVEAAKALDDFASGRCSVPHD